MKYRVCVNQEFGKTINQKLKEGNIVRENITGDVIELVAFSVEDPEDERPDALLLFDGSILGYLRAKLNDFTDHIDSTRFGWPKLVETEE